MENVSFFKGSFWDVLNGPIIPLIIVIVGVITFFVVFSKENRRINKIIEKHRQKHDDNVK